MDVVVGGFWGLLDWCSASAIWSKRSSSISCFIVEVRIFCLQKFRVKRFVRVWWFGYKSWGWNDLSVFDGLAKKFRVKRFVCCCLFGEWLILGSGYRWYLDTGITVSLILGSGYRWYLDTGITVSLILGSGYRWYLVLGIVDTRFWVSLILGSGYHWYLDQGIIDIRFGVSLILGSGYRWYLDTGIWVSLILGSGYRWCLDTGIWVSLILGLGICGYACNMWKLLLDDSPTKHLKRHSFFHRRSSHVSCIPQLLLHP